jgi:hypothetical protein
LFSTCHERIIAILDTPVKFDYPVKHA